MRSVQPSLRRYLTGLAGAAEADDLLQDVLVIVVRRIETLEDPKLFRPWSVRIASREAFRHIKKRRLWQGRDEDDAQLDGLPMPPVAPSGRGGSDSGHPGRHGEVAPELRIARHAEPGALGPPSWRR